MKYIYLLGVLLAAIVGLAQDDDAIRERDSFLWGKAQYGVRVGLRYHDPSDQMGTTYYLPHRVTVAIGSADPGIHTNYYTKLRLYKRSYTITLRDSLGKELPKTAEGKTRRMHLRVFSRNYYNHRDVNMLYCQGQAPRQIGMFDIDECFVRKSGGRYELEVQVALLKDAGDPKHLEPVEFEGVKLTLELPDKADVKAPKW